MPDKPPYRVPTMAEIRALPWNGLTCASTFSGCGGSSTGYRMAGFRMLYANEFVEAARDSYRANAAPYTFVDGRDIRTVTAADVLSAMGLKEGELDLLDGSPPCASFSTCGKREDGWGKVKKYSDKAQRTDDLFFEYARLLRGLRPRAFVAENVSGLVKGTAKGYFKLILQELKDCGYRVRAQLLDAQWLGVPQKRQRLIFVGTRDDLGIEPAFPTPLPYRYVLRDALPGFSGVIQVGNPNHAQATGNTFPRGELLRANETPGAVTANGMAGGSPVHVLSERVEREAWITQPALGAELDKLAPGQNSSRYFNMSRATFAEPAPTILSRTGSSKVGVSHPTEKRLLSIAELRRVCSFPDDFVLTGNYGQQWERLGRAVPPVMMKHIAAAVRDRVLGGGKRHVAAE